MKASFISRAICPFAGQNSLVLLLLIFIFSACDTDDVEYSRAPEISLNSLSHDTILQYEDVLLLSIKYQDGDGDLGFENPEDYALFVRDVRLENFDGFYVGPLAPPGQSIPIQGNLTVEFPSLFLFGSGQTEKTFFEIKMVDRAGNESNTIETDPVVIKRE